MPWKLTWLVVLAGLAACGDPDTNEPEPTTVERGQVAYDRYCALCHGPDGEGYLGDRAVALGNDAFLRTASDDFLVAATLEGRPGTSMAPYGTQFQGPLEAGDASDIVAYLRTWQDGEPTDIDFVVEGDAAAGAAVFARDCASCHGEQAQGVSACSLNNPVFLRTASDGFLRIAIADGRQGTAMGAYGGQLSDDEIDDVVAYIRSFQ
jgi:cytochrome c oxidase cbb3-type subunit III